MPTSGVSGDLVVCPFKGLASFDVEDGAFFSGRERLVAELVARLTGAPLIGIVGASGSGKSSALRAGLLAALAAGVLPGSERWAQALLRPGEHPLRALEQATAERREPRVIAVDQFEELFTRLPRRGRARGVRRRAGRPARATRAGACWCSSPSAPTSTAAARPTRSWRGCWPPTTSWSGRCGATSCAARSSCPRAAPACASSRTSSTRSWPTSKAEPGALPLLSTSLLELWQHRDGRTLRLADYEHAGGVHGAVARLAERAYERLDPEQQQVARRLLLRLAGEGEGDAVVRRRVDLAELGGDDVAEVLAVLADERLVTIGDGEVEVAHEALLREWPRLRDWLAGGRRGAPAAPAPDPRGARLAGRRPRPGGALPRRAAGGRAGLERRPRAGAQRARARVPRREPGRRPRARARASGGPTAGSARCWAAWRRCWRSRSWPAPSRSRSAARRGDAALTADAQRLGAEALTRERLDQALLLARAGVDLDDSAATRGHLLSVLMRAPAGARHAARRRGGRCTTQP